MGESFAYRSKSLSYIRPEVLRLISEQLSLESDQDLGPLLNGRDSIKK